jgi:hypothetical protein
MTLAVNRRFSLMSNYKKKLFIQALVGTLLSFPISAQEQVNRDLSDDIQEQVNQVYSEAADLERDIGLLEKELLFPPLTRIEVFLSVDPELDFELKSVAMTLDGDEKSFHVYTASDLTALQMGGLQQFWEGNVALGEHLLKIDFQGLSDKNKPVKKTITKTFEKTREGLAFEVQVNKSTDASKPAFAVKAWGNR